MKKSATRLLVNNITSRTYLSVTNSTSRYYAIASNDRLKNLKATIDKANQQVLDVYYKADIILEDIRPAGEVIPALKNDKLVLVSGPPVTWKNMSGAQRGSVMGIVMFEGWANTPEDAVKLIESGAVKFEPNHNHGCVGPMAGTVSKSMPVYVVRNRAFGNQAFARCGDLAQLFGDYTNLSDVYWWKDTISPYLSQALRATGGLPMNILHQLALEMGDEGHNRNHALTSLFAQAMAVGMIKAGVPNDKMLTVLEWYNYPTWDTGSGVRACLGLALASSKACMDPAKGIKGSTLVTCLTRNGYEFGVKIADTGEDWFVHQSPYPIGKFFPGFSQEDAGRDTGDSAITEANGWGSNVLNGALAFLKVLPTNVAQAEQITKENKSLMIGRSPIWTTPVFDFEGIPQGMDIRRIVNWKLLPWINTGIIHKDPGHRVIGRGLSRPPLECFEKAVEGFAKNHGVTVAEVLATDDSKQPL